MHICSRCSGEFTIRGSERWPKRVFWLDSSVEAIYCILVGDYLGLNIELLIYARRSVPDDLFSV